MITYEGIKLAAELVAFASITAVVYLIFPLRKVIKEVLGGSTVRMVYVGVIVFWSGYLVNVLNDVFPLEFMKVLDDVIVAIGMVIITVSMVGIKKEITAHVKPEVVLNGTSGVETGAYLIKPLPLQRILGLIPGKRVLAITRDPQPYEEAGVPHIWLTNMDHPRAISPTSLAPLLHAVKNSADDNTFVILDGLHYLIVQNGFESTLKFLLSLKDILLQKGAGIMLIVDPGTLEKRQLAILEREFKWMPE
ncbi:DUF835 domain-containing protein [Thermococcus sp. P6]|uniref:DUF835 domain-containing protein n=1 Tax=Thermococcus sp. P6 TaxID=122420 RepID=UPI0012FE67C7|nr:DUF835 domain-containing protein [Thermococcus sp. P6]